MDKNESMPLSAHLSKQYSFSTQTDTVAAMEMGRELFDAGVRSVRLTAMEKLSRFLNSCDKCGKEKAENVLCDSCVAGGEPDWHAFYTDSQIKLYAAQEKLERIERGEPEQPELLPCYVENGVTIHRGGCGECRTPIDKLVSAAQEFLKHDGGPGSEDYDAIKIYHARRTMQAAFGFRCPRCGETLPHMHD